jgi:hypothetical protein
MPGATSGPARRPHAHKSALRGSPPAPNQKGKSLIFSRSLRSGLRRKDSLTGSYRIDAIGQPDRMSLIAVTAEMKKGHRAALCRWTPDSSLPQFFQI